MPSSPAGMPPLDASADKIGWFEFASPKYFYIPIGLYCSWLALRYGGLMLPTCSNPALPHSGFVGESKKQVLDSLSGPSRQYIAPYKAIQHNGSIEQTYTAVIEAMQQLDTQFPVVMKPDLGMRGAGVQKINSPSDVKKYLENFPHNASFLLQQLIDYKGEAGVFYVRHPDWKTGKLISLTLKYFPTLIGDGENNIATLLQQSPRAGKLQHLYRTKLTPILQDTPAKGAEIPLAFAGNHCRGAIFRNGNTYITQALTQKFDQIAKDIKIEEESGFFIGRFDVRFQNFEQFLKGEDFKIIEINGAGGEATHIWDSRTTLPQAYKSLMTQFKHIYQIGHKNKKRGHRPSSLSHFLKDWKTEKTLTNLYPPSS